MRPFLTARLQTVVSDRHLHVEYSAEPPPSEATPSPDEMARRREHDEHANYGTERVEHLPGNIGYIDLHSVPKTAWAADSLAAAMTLVAHADALIIDLRENGGGYPATAKLVESYVFDARTHAVDVWWRDSDRTEQFWTQDSVPGVRFGQAKPVWLLTSARTFSGAEQFTYDLKNLKRATVVGETTGGGANPGKFVALDAHFGLFLPTGHAISPITHGNWEGTGVEPDVKVDAASALVVAKGLALEKLIALEKDEGRRAILQGLASKAAPRP
jgi:C-terminal processing protease CtpA/Prc